MVVRSLQAWRRAPSNSPSVRISYPRRRPHSVDAGVRVGRKTGAILPCAADHSERALLQQALEAQDIIAGNPEYVA